MDVSLEDYSIGLFDTSLFIFNWTGEPNFGGLMGLKLGIIAQLSYISYEGIKSNVVLWGFEFPGEDQGTAHGIILSWVESGLPVFPHEDLE